MTDPSPPAPPPQNLALIKLVTALLGLMLLGGTALLVTLLVLRAPPAADPFEGALREGETVLARFPAEDGAAAMLVQGPGGETWLLHRAAHGEALLRSRLSEPEG